MKIDASLSFPQQDGPQRVGTTGTSPSQSDGLSVNLSPDQAQFSVDGETVEQLKAGLANVPDVRMDRVVALQQAITTGNYNVSGQQIAQAMSSDLLGKAQ